MQGNKAGSRGKVMRTGDFWERKESVCSHHTDAEEARYDCLTEKGTKACANTDKNYGLI